MRIVIWLLPVVMVLQTPVAKAQLSREFKNYEQHYYKGMRYGLFKPATANPEKSYPLIVYLHGSRDTVSRSSEWYKRTTQNNHPCFVLSPKCEEPNLGWGDTWHKEHTPAAAKTLQLVDSLIRCYPIDTNRLYLYGISMGGFGVFSLLTKETGKFAAGYAVCGGANPETAGKLLSTPLWIFHGELDNIVPVYLSRDMYREIVRLGGKNVHYTEYPGVRHNSWENVAKEKTLEEWLFAQRKKPVVSRTH